MEPRTALLCDAHVWILAGCPICALEREISTREGADRRIEELEGAIRDHKLSTWSNLITDEDRVLWEILDDTRGRNDGSYKCNQTDYHGEVVRLRRRIEELETKLDKWEHAFALWDNETSCGGNTQNRMRDLMRKAK